MQMNVTEIVIAIVGLVFSAVVIPLTRAAFAWLKGRTRNEAMRAAIGEAQTVADNVVARLKAAVVDGLKEKSADGKLSADDAAQIMDMAVGMAVSDLSSHTLAIIEDNADDITAYLSNLIEARLLRIKKGGMCSGSENA
jgi:hypothetical protein